MDELMALEECDHSITDSTVSSDADQGLFTVEVIVRTDDPVKASENRAFNSPETMIPATP